jgi:hypothetical protein
MYSWAAQGERQVVGLKYTNLHIWQIIKIVQRYTRIWSHQGPHIN